MKKEFDFQRKLPYIYSMLKINDIVLTPLKRNRFSVRGMHGHVEALKDGNAIHPAGLALVRMMSSDECKWFDIARLIRID